MCLSQCKVNEETNEALLDEENKIPIIYSTEYNVDFCGLQNLHPFDAAKGMNILKILKAAQFVINDEQLYKPKEMKQDELLFVHSKRYIKSLKWSFNVAKIAEIPLLVFVPNYFVQQGYLRPMRCQTAGSILAAECALKNNGWAINLGGGFHHCSADKGGGFCPYADVTLTIKSAMSGGNGIEKVMIVDLDAHQGNGYAHDFMDDANVYILDMYNYRIYPRDHPAKLAIKRAVELKPHTEDREYMNKLKISLKKSLQEFQPNMIIYNAGTDILKGDALGLLDISPAGVLERDEFVFEMARSQNVPIVMLLSGGYLRSSAKVIADSILNLNEKGYLPYKK